MRITIYCDGGCRGQDKRNNLGGYGAVLQRSKNGPKETIMGVKPNTTNNRMELYACIKALDEVRGNDQPVKLISDSKYVIQGVNRLAEFWEDNGWKTNKNEPVKNQDLWCELLDHQDRLDVIFEHVKRATMEGNLMADRLANKAMNEYTKKVR